MKIAIIGAGFTGLSAALFLSEKYEVEVFEKENTLGGLASTAKLRDIPWPIEKHYHHWFTNDKDVLNLIRKLNLEKDILLPRSQTSIYYNGKSYPFNSPYHVIIFSPLTIIERIRTGFMLLFLKILPWQIALRLEKYPAYQVLRKMFGDHAYSVLWKPLLVGKFGKFAKDVNMAWFWARIKKRTPVLAYMKGGYQKLISKMGEKILKNGGMIYLNTSFDTEQLNKFDKVIFTTPSYTFLKYFPDLKLEYKNKLSAIKHLHALNMLLVTKNKFLSDTYWLNINDRKFPFIGVIQHTNLAHEKYYNGLHLTWIANYLPPDHLYLKLPKEQLFKIYLPYLQEINPGFNFKTIVDYHLFIGNFAQPVMGINYSKIRPVFKTPVKKVYLANMDMVYPWDRGTNYAIELGRKVSEYILR